MHERLIAFLTERLPNLVHPGTEGSGPHPLRLPGLAPAGIPDDMLAGFAEEAGLPSVDTPRLIAEALVYAMAATGIIDPDLTKTEADQLRAQAADARDGTRAIRIKTTPTAEPVLVLAVKKDSDEVIVPAAALKAIGEHL